jgi:hypothetical protein
MHNAQAIAIAIGLHVNDRRGRDEPGLRHFHCEAMTEGRWLDDSLFVHDLKGQRIVYSLYTLSMSFMQAIQLDPTQEFWA